MLSSRFVFRKKCLDTFRVILKNNNSPSLQCTKNSYLRSAFYSKFMKNHTNSYFTAKEYAHKWLTDCNSMKTKLCFMPTRGYLNNLKSVHENYALFRKGQDIGYLSTLMVDPTDAHIVKEENYHELHHYFDIPELAENIKDKLVEVKISQRTKVQYNSPTGSWMQIIYPFAEKRELADKYRKFAENQVMVGKMLEEIDALCAETAYRYIRGCGLSMEGVSTVTAAVDHLDFDAELRLDENLKINTYVIYTGSSTVYVKSDMYSKRDDKWIYKGHTIFIMAARQGGKSFKVPPMTFEGEDDPELGKTRQLLGNELKDYIVNLNNNLYKQSPNNEESVMIHDLFKKVKFDKDQLTTVTDTVLKHNTLMHKQEKNSYGKVFGGFLMNRATEAAFLNARRFSEELNPRISHIDTIKFIKPVEIGHIMQFRSRVTYTTSNILRIAVSALDITENCLEGDLTNEFHFVFELKNKAKEIYPESYYDALLYLEGKRRTEHLFLFHNK